MNLNNSVDIDSEKMQLILKKKLDDPTSRLSNSESISLIDFCISEGLEKANSITGKTAVILIGNTGAGKSTFVNYVLGCEMIKKTSEEMDEIGVEVLCDVVVVKSRSEGGCYDEVTAIGHNKKSTTFMPQLKQDSNNPKMVYCDCPGFSDNRGAEIRIVNAVTIKQILKAADGVKVIILINYNSLLADRARGLSDLLKICTKLFGNSENLELARDSILLGVTQAPKSIKLTFLKKWKTHATP
jgi:predicted GTPase